MTSSNSYVKIFFQGFWEYGGDGSNSKVLFISLNPSMKTEQPYIKTENP